VHWAERTRLRKLARDDLDHGTVSAVTGPFEHVAIEFLGVYEFKWCELYSEAIKRHGQFHYRRATGSAPHLVWGVGLEEQRATHGWLRIAAPGPPAKLAPGAATLICDEATRSRVPRSGSPTNSGCRYRSGADQGLPPGV